MESGGTRGPRPGPAGFQGGSGVRACLWAGEHPPAPPSPTGLSHRPATPPSQLPPLHLINLQTAGTAQPSWTPSGDSQIKPKTGKGEDPWVSEVDSAPQVLGPDPAGPCPRVLGVSLTEGSLCLSRGTQLSFLPPLRTFLPPIHPETTATQTFPEHSFYHVTPCLWPGGGSPVPVGESASFFPRNS